MTERRYFAAVWIAVPVVVLVLLGAFVRVPYVVMGPGLAQDTLGKMGESKVISIEGAPVHDPKGELLFTTVEVRDGLDVFSAIRYGIDPRYQLAPRDAVFPPGKSRAQVTHMNQQMFFGSEDDATSAALRFLNIPTAPGVAGVRADGPSHDLLQPGDVLKKVAGVPIGTLEDVIGAVDAHRPGQTVPVRVERGGDTVTVDIRLGKRTEGEGDQRVTKPALGILVGRVPADSKLKIRFGVGDVGGPSAGLMLTLGIIDLLEPGDLTGDRIVAGTGTISPDGEVGEIGGIDHKVIGASEEGATVFLVPAPNCPLAKSTAPDGLQLVKVHTLADAVAGLADVREGRPAPTC